MTSPDIWTRCGGKSNFRRLQANAWRLVEAQHVTATRKLVDTDEEQRLLEDAIEGVKPRRSVNGELAGLHYLLHTPFRYPPLRHGSRFGTRLERSLWYGSTTLPTAQAEVAYYRLLFFAGTTASLDTTELALTAFRVKLRTGAGVDLTRPPFLAHRDEISSKTSYGASQPLGSAMRAAGVEAFTYVSSRDPEAGTNIGLFTPRAFAEKAPTTSQTWACIASRERVEFLRADLLRTERVAFGREAFCLGGELPGPGV